MVRIPTSTSRLRSVRFRVCLWQLVQQEKVPREVFTRCRWKNHSNKELLFEGYPGGGAKRRHRE